MLKRKGGMSMGKSGLPGKKAQVTPVVGKKVFAAVCVIAVLITGFVVVKLAYGEDAGNRSGDLVILKSEVSETARFYPYRSGKTKMEVLAVKAGDGTIRTAFNTCQVCFDSGRGYYKQEGAELVCQNCGNRFLIDHIERVRGGCNPVPILKENKTEDDERIVIPKAFLEASKGLFEHWK